jgi:hypothetical protein
MTDRNIFKVNEHKEIVCEWVNTRYGFRHDARLFIDGKEVGKKAKVCYYNRTWERFEYQTVLRILLEKTEYLTEEEKNEFGKRLGLYT